MCWEEEEKGRKRGKQKFCMATPSGMMMLPHGSGLRKVAPHTHAHRQPTPNFCCTPLQQN
jgi:hypothetical protein